MAAQRTYKRRPLRLHLDRCAGIPQKDLNTGLENSTAYRKRNAFLRQEFRKFHIYTKWHVFGGRGTEEYVKFLTDAQCPDEVKFLSSIATQRMEREGCRAGGMLSRVGWLRYSPFQNTWSGPLPQQGLILVPLVRTCPGFHQACSSRPVGRISEPRLPTDYSPHTRQFRTPWASSGYLWFLESG